MPKSYLRVIAAIVAMLATLVLIGCGGDASSASDAPSATVTVTGPVEPQAPGDVPLPDTSTTPAPDDADSPPGDSPPGDTAPSGDDQVPDIDPDAPAEAQVTLRFDKMSDGQNIVYFDLPSGETTEFTCEELTGVNDCIYEEFQPFFNVYWEYFDDYLFRSDAGRIGDDTVNPDWFSDSFYAGFAACWHTAEGHTGYGFYDDLSQRNRFSMWNREDLLKIWVAANRFLCPGLTP